jgi:hypothetical protein
MTTVQTRVREISNKEGFDIIIVTRNGKPVKTTRNGVLGPWVHRNKTRDTHSVSDFRVKFEQAYPGYSCDVMDGTGRKAHGNMFLKQVRATY